MRKRLILPSLLAIISIISAFLLATLNNLLPYMLMLINGENPSGVFDTLLENIVPALPQYIFGVIAVFAVFGMCIFANVSVLPSIASAVYGAAGALGALSIIIMLIFEAAPDPFHSDIFEVLGRLIQSIFGYYDAPHLLFSLVSALVLAFLGFFTLLGHFKRKRLGKAFWCLPAAIYGVSFISAVINSFSFIFNRMYAHSYTIDISVLFKPEFMESYFLPEILYLLPSLAMSIFYIAMSFVILVVAKHGGMKKKPKAEA